MQGSIEWLVRNQRFDHRESRARGDQRWPYKTPANVGCGSSVSCYHGVVAALRALAAVPAEHRAPAVRGRLEEAVAWLRTHRVFLRSDADRPLLRHLLRPFLAGVYRCHLVDTLDGPRQLRVDVHPEGRGRHASGRLAVMLAARRRGEPDVPVDRQAPSGGRRWCAWLPRGCGVGRAAFRVESSWVDVQ